MVSARSENITSLTKGYTTPVEDGKYLGALAWANEAGEIMELTRV